MPLQLDSALTTLDRGGQAKGADDRLRMRLQDVQGFLGRELAEVESRLAETVSVGPRPGTDSARHLVAQGGKRVRPLALLLSARCFGEIPPAALDLAAVVELVHSATLLHDDVVDEGMERRGAATSRMLFGNGVSVLSGDLLLVHALERTSHAAPQHLTHLITTLRRLVDGEIVQLRGRTEVDVTEETYFRILHDKTASLFSFATRTGAALGGASATAIDALGRFGEALGVAFQLVDDVIDYVGESSGKTLFADLAEGKLTLPLVLAAQRVDGLSTKIARVHAGERALVDEVSHAVVASGACDEVRRRAREQTSKAIGALSVVAPSPARSVLELVAQELTARMV